MRHAVQEPFSLIDPCLAISPIAEGTIQEEVKACEVGCRLESGYAHLGIAVPGGVM